MLHNLYYSLKPIIPRKLQISLRRFQVRMKLASNSHKWPISETSARAPSNWRGWPDKKDFALVLTHDIESAKGLKNVRNLMQLEMGLGFRSSFNFVLDDYEVPPELFDELRSKGFEIGIHGVTHRGNIYNSQKEFLNASSRINNGLKEWGAVGFRCPSMFHDLKLNHHLDIEYDSSTFDTDPFEPQPDGMDTIFPFWVPRFQAAGTVEVTGGNSNNAGYVELPYTMPQDFLAFILMKGDGLDTWTRKLAWIAANGGMALMVTHPDYMSFEEKAGYEEYPARKYSEFLQYIKTAYKGQYWHALPRDVARYVKDQNLRAVPTMQSPSANIPAQPLAGSEQEITPSVKAHPEPARAANGKKIWIDLDNSPHVPFFRPIMSELNKRGYETVITARDCFQVCGLADLAKVPYEKIGRHYGKNPIMKVLGLLIRSLQLVPVVLREKPKLAVSHGSRSQLFTSKLMNIPTIVIMDYEFAQMIIRPTFFIIPELLSKSKAYHGHPFFQYPGIKEDIYVPDFVPDPGIMSDLGLDPDKLIVTIRPPATEAHYHNPEAEKLFEHVINFLDKRNDVQMVILPRNEKTQTAYIQNTWPSLIKDRKVIIPDHAVDGLNLIWFSDLVISGGGTMNREAAALGVPVYSIFRGTIGAVDQYLEYNERLVLLTSKKDIETKLKLKRRDKPLIVPRKSKDTLNTLVNEIVTVLDNKS